MLAPEEVLDPRSSDVRVRSELTPAEKRTRRARERKAKKKMRLALDKHLNAKKSSKGSAKQEKEAALKSLVKSGKGVTVVGKGSRTQKTGKLAKKAK